MAEGSAVLRVIWRAGSLWWLVGRCFDVVVLHIESTINNYLALAGLPSREARRAAWTGDYEPAHRDIFTLYYSGYGHPSARDTAADHADEQAHRIQSAHDAAISSLESAETTLRREGWLSGPDVPVVLFVGVGASNAWVDVHRGQPTLFWALEQFNPATRDVVAAHEMIHIAHYRRVDDTTLSRSEFDGSARVLTWVEGVAVAGSRLAVPGLPERDYFMVEDDTWATACQAALPELRTAMLDDPLHVDPQLAYALCAHAGAAAAKAPWPDRAGYWLGSRAAQHALDQGKSFTEILNLDTDDITQHLHAALRP